MPHRIHAGKNEPRMLNVGAREHPAANSCGANNTPAMATRCMTWLRGICNLRVHLLPLHFGGMVSRPFRMKQVACLKSQPRHTGQQLGPRAHIGSARSGEGALCRNHIDLAADPVGIGL
jgi:hypothetical protein